MPFDVNSIVGPLEPYRKLSATRSDTSDSSEGNTPWAQPPYSPPPPLQSQVGAVVIIVASHRCDLGSILGCDTPVFLPPHQNQLSRQNLCRRAYWSRAYGSGDQATTPDAGTLN